MTDEPSITLQRFEALAGAYGADFDRWPEQERAAARRLALASLPAREILRAAAALDAALDDVPVPSPSRELWERVAAIPQTQARSAAIDLHLSRRTAFATALGLAAAAVLGLVVGNLAPTPRVEGQTAANGATSDDWVELTELAFAEDLQEDLWQ